MNKSMQNWFWGIVSLMATIAFLYVLTDNWVTVAILIVSVVVHELSHLYSLKSYGVDSTIKFYGLIALTKPNPEQMARLNFFQFGNISFAGPVSNLAIMAISYLLWLATGQQFLYNAAAINANLAAWNLIPFFIFDGGKIAHAVFSSLFEKDELKVTIPFMFVCLGIALYQYFMHQDQTFITVVLIGMLIGSLLDNPNDAVSHKAMPKKQALQYAAIFAAVLFTSYLLFLALPFKA